MTTKRLLSFVMALCMVMSLLVFPAYATTEATLLGDLNGDGFVTTDDVVALVLYLSMPDQFPLEGHLDFDGKNGITTDDAVQLLLHVSMPDNFPLETAPQETEPTDPVVESLVLGDNAVALEAGSETGKTWTYTAEFTGKLNLTVSSLKYAFDETGEFYEASQMDMEMGFFRMYAFNINGENVGAYTTSVDVTEGDVITVGLVSYSGFATEAVITLEQGAEQGGDVETVVSTQDIVLAAGDLDGETISYVVQNAGNLNIAVTAMAYDWEGSGVFTEASEMDLQMGFGRMYCLTIDGVQYYQSSVDIDVFAGQLVEVNLMSASGYATNATITFTETAGEGGGDTTEPTVPGGDEGTQANPFVIDALPYSIPFFGGMDQYYTYTTTEAGNIVVSYLEGGILSLPGGEAWDQDENMNYIIPVAAGYELVLNPWTMQPEISGEMVVTFVGEGTEPSDPTEPSVGVDGKFLCKHCGEEITFTEWTGAEITESGHYYLPDDVALTAAIRLKGGVDVVVELNGHKITADGCRAFYVNGGTPTLSIQDSVGTGEITGGSVTDARGGNIYASSGNVHIYGGKIYGGTASTGNNSGNDIAVYNGEFTVSGNAQIGQAYETGYAVFLFSCTKMEIADATITGGLLVRSCDIDLRSSLNIDRIVLWSAKIQSVEARTGEKIAIQVTTSSGTYQKGAFTTALENAAEAAEYFQVIEGFEIVESEGVLSVDEVVVTEPTEPSTEPSEPSTEPSTEPSDPSEPEAETSGTISIGSYENADWIAPQDGYVKFTINIAGAGLVILNGYTPLAEGTDSVTVQVTAGTTYGVCPQFVDVNSVVTWEYVEGGDVGGDVESLPSGSALALGDNNVTLTYANMPMMAPYWTYTATENGYLTVTVTSINGESNLGMAFGRGMYTLLVGDTDGAFTNTAAVYMTAGQSVKVSVLDTLDMVEVPAVLNLTFAAGEPVVEKDPADYFDKDENGNYVIGSLESPVDIFVGNDDINYSYTAEAAGTVTITATVDEMTGTNCWLKVNDGAWDYYPSTVVVAEGDVVIINIWNGYEGTVTFEASPSEPSTEPTTPSEPEEEGYIQITSADQLVSGQYVMIVGTGYAPGLFDNGWLTAVQPVVDGDKVTDTHGAVWTLTVTADGVSIKDANGVFVAPKGGNNNGIINAEYVWAVSFENGAFRFAGTGSDTVILASNPQYENKFRGYKAATVTSYPDSYPCDFTLFKLVGDAPVDPTEPSEPSTEPTDPSTEPSAPAVDYVTTPVVGQAYKFMLTQVNLGKNLYITGAMDGYYYATTEDAAAAVTVYFEEAEGGYRVYFLNDGVKTYMEMVKSGNYNNVVFTTAPTKVLKWNAEIASVTCDLDGTEFYFGTYNTFDTFSASKISYVTGNNAASMDVTNFVGHFYVTEGEAPVEPTEPTEPSTEPTEPSESEPVVEAGYVKITSADQLVSGQYVMIVGTGYAPGLFDNGWLTAVQPVVDGDKVTNTQGAVWTLTVTDGGVIIQDSEGMFVAPKGGNNNGIINAEYVWAVSFENGTFRFAGTGSDTVILASNVGSENKFRGYKSTTVTGYPDSYPCDFTLYALVGEDTPVEPTEPTEPSETEPVVLPQTPAEIVNAAYALAPGETLEGTYTLTGVISAINTPYSEQYGNVTVTIVVEGMEDFPIQCYRLAGTGADQIGKGDTITVTGSLTNYNGNIQFAQGCTLDAWEDTGAEEVLPVTPEEIVNAAYALATGEAMSGTYTLTGVITKIDTAYSAQYGNITVTIVVGDMTDKPIMCYRLKGDGADQIKVGDTITVTGAIKNYYGTVEFDSGCTLDAWTAGGEAALTWQEYVKMTGAEQRSYKESFENSDDYYAWLADAQAKYDAEHESVMDGVINMGDLVNKG